MAEHRPQQPDLWQQQSQLSGGLQPERQGQRPPGVPLLPLASLSSAGGLLRRSEGLSFLWGTCQQGLTFPLYISSGLSQARCNVACQPAAQSTLESVLVQAAPLCLCCRRACAGSWGQLGIL